MSMLANTGEVQMVYPRKTNIVEKDVREIAEDESATDENRQPTGKQSVVPTSGLTPTLGGHDNVNQLSPN